MIPAPRAPLPDPTGRRPPPARPVATPADLSRVLGVPYTEEQLSAITAPLEPGVIVAGAGSGKTTVMAARVVWLAATGQVAPGEVLGLTFTNKAAAELRERVGTALEKAGLSGEPEPEPAGPGADPDELGEPVISTYHAYADRLIKEHGLRLGLEPSTRLLADASRYTLAARVVRSAAGPFEELRGSIANITRDLVDLDAELSEHVVTIDQLRDFDREFAARAEAFRDPATGRSVRAKNRGTRRLGLVYEQYLKAAATSRGRAELLTLVEDYRRLKGARDFVDFGDQMALATRLAEQVPQVGRIERDKYRVVLLDEYQDTSVAQRRMLAGLFAGPDPDRGAGHPVTAVGDPCQSIYGWRGASAANIDQFPEHFPRADGSPARIHPLTENRRSGGRLLAFANEQSAGLRLRHPGVARLTACAPKADLGYAVAALLPTLADEVRWLADQIQSLAGAVPWSGVAVLVRKGNQIPAIYAELHGRGIPVEVVGLSGLLDLPEIADLVAMLDVLDDPIANASLVRLLTGPRWRIGARDLALLGRRARELVRPPGAAGPDGALEQAVATSDPTDVVSLSDALADPGEAIAFSDEARRRFARFAAEIRRLRRGLAEPVLDVLHRILQETGLDVEIAASPAAYRQRCAETVGAFLSIAGNFADHDGEQSATAFRAFLRAAAEHERGLDIDLPPTEAQTVKILTMHKAKGLEWDVVAVPHQYREAPKADKWTAKRAKLPHALRGDPMPPLGPERDKTAFEEFDAAMREHAQLEDERLTYVTLTRAKYRLLVSSHWWGPTQTRRREPGDMLVALRGHCLADAANGSVEVWTPPPAEERNPALAAGLETVWPLDPRDEARERRRQASRAVTVESRRRAEAGEADGPCPPPRPADLDEASRRIVEGWDTDLEALLGELRRVRDVRFDVVLPRALSTTRLMAYAADPEAFAEELFRPMPQPPAPQSRRGTEFHAWVERRFGQLTLFDEDDLDLFAEDEVEDAEDLAALKEAFLRGEYAQRRPLRVEAPFQLLLAGHVVRGRIDAVYQDSDGMYEVVDWKTNRRANADPLQLAVYRLAWAELAGVPVERVRAAFVYVRTGAVHRVADLPDRAALERWAGSTLRSG